MIGKDRPRSVSAASRHWGRLVVGLIGIVLVLSAAVAAIPAVSPAAGASTADLLRSIVGPQPVAELESLSYWLHDAFKRSVAAIRPGGVGVTWAGGTVTDSQGPAANSAGGTYGRSSRSPHLASLSPNVAGLRGQRMQGDVVNTSPQVGWQAYGPQLSGDPAMARALVLLDPQRSYAGVALVRIDLSRLSLHIVPGSIEPAHPSGIDQLIPNLGMVSPQDYSQLVAAFNGGFKALHGHYGMMVNGTTLLPAVNGMATVALYRDGSVRIGAWGTDIVASPDLVSFRQNCPPLIEAGQINVALSTDARGAWGFTSNSDITWRTGLGITQDGRYLIYAVGNGTNAQFLAEALRQAGAYNAMQLDINQYYAHFVTYSSSAAANAGGGEPFGQPLLQQMTDVKNLYLSPNPRDFFYLTARD